MWGSGRTQHNSNEKALKLSRSPLELRCHGQHSPQRLKLFGLLVSFDKQADFPGSTKVVYHLFLFFQFAVLHMASERRRFDHIHERLALKYFSTRMCFHLFLNPRAIDSSCSLSFCRHHLLSSTLLKATNILKHNAYKSVRKQKTIPVREKPGGIYSHRCNMAVLDSSLLTTYNVIPSGGQCTSVEHLFLYILYFSCISVENL